MLNSEEQPNAEGNGPSEKKKEQSLSPLEFEAYLRMRMEGLALEKKRLSEGDSEAH